MELTTKNFRLPTAYLELTTANYQLKKREIDQISKFLVEFSEVDRLILFGSRAMGNAKLGSDLDLAVVGAQVDDRIMSKITDYLENQTNLPYLIDLIHFDKIENLNLLEHITQFGKTIYQRKQS
ncbi:nucleotidyltransferase domain-containing protein [bacterium]|nr:nucleotidyltransferase domain-containing protein [bacterium]